MQVSDYSQTKLKVHNTTVAYMGVIHYILAYKTEIYIRDLAKWKSVTYRAYMVYDVNSNRKSVHRAPILGV